MHPPDGRIEQLGATPTSDPPARYRALAAASVIVSLCPIVAVFAYIATYGVNAPVWDDWDTVRIVSHALSGNLSIHDLWALKGEHRTFFPRLAELGLAYLDRFDTRVEMVGVAVSSLAVLAVLALAARRTLGWRASFVVPLLAIIVLSLRQYVNFLLGSGLQFAFAVGFAVVALYLVARAAAERSDLWLAGAAVCATVSTYSSGGAIVVWVAGLLVLWLAGSPLWRSRIAFWGALGVLETALYLRGYRVTLPGTPPPTFALHHPGLTGVYLLRLFGGSLFATSSAALIAGAALGTILVASLVLVVRSRRAREDALWLSLTFFGVMSLIVIAVGRVGYGPDGALGSRYAIYSLLTLAALVGLLSQQALQARDRTGAVLFAVLTCLVLASMPWTYRAGIDAGKRERDARLRAAAILFTYRSQPDEMLLDVWQQPTLMRNWAGILRNAKYSVFASSAPPRQPSPPPHAAGLPSLERPSTCKVDFVGRARVAGQLLPLSVEPDRGGVVVRGWCVDPEAEDVAGGVYVDLDGKRMPVDFYGILRGDVARLFDRRRVLYSGFDVVLRGPFNGSRVHRLSIVAVSRDGRGVFEPRPVIWFVVQPNLRLPLPPLANVLFGGDH